MARQESLLARSRAGCMVRCKMTQGRVTVVSCLLDLTISLRLSLAMSEQSLKNMYFSWASWTSHRKKRQFDEEHGRKADGQRSPGILVDCPVSTGI